MQTSFTENHEVKRNRFDILYKEWSDAISQGNEYFENYHTLLALFCYLKAIELVDPLIKHQPTSRQSLGALLLSYHNLSDLYVRENSLRQAWNALVQARQRVIAVFCKHGETPGTCWGCQLAHRQLSWFENEYGSFDNFTPKQRINNTYLYQSGPSVH